MTYILLHVSHKLWYISLLVTFIREICGKIAFLFPPLKRQMNCDTEAPLFFSHIRNHLSVQSHCIVVKVPYVQNTKIKVGILDQNILIVSVRILIESIGIMKLLRLWTKKFWDDIRCFFLLWNIKLNMGREFKGWNDKNEKLPPLKSFFSLKWQFGGEKALALSPLFVWNH